MTLNFTRGHRVTGNLEHVQKMLEAKQVCVRADYAREITSEKSCKHCEYGLFEHLLFLCLVCYGTLY